MMGEEIETQEKTRNQHRNEETEEEGSNRQTANNDRYTIKEEKENKETKEEKNCLAIKKNSKTTNQAN